MPSSINGSDSRRTHYQTLGLQENCTERQVKDAFIALSKEHHPDVNPSDPSRNDQFVKIYEAYSVLSRPERRQIYDSSLRFKERFGYHHDDLTVKTDAPYYTTWRDESIWGMRDKTRADFNENKPYYGIKGLKRVSNYWIAGGAVLLMVLGSLMHYTALKHSTTFTVSQLDTKDERIARELLNVKRTAKRNGNDLQLDLLRSQLGWGNTAPPTGKND